MWEPPPLTSTGGHIANVGAGNIQVTGATTLNATGDVILDNAGNDFVGAVVTTATGNATLVDANDLTLGGTTVAGSLTATASGSIADAGANVDVAGLVDLSGTSIVLGTGTFNAGTLTFNSGGSVDIEESSSTLISGASNAGAGLTLLSTGNVTLDANVTVVGNTSIIAGTASGGIAVNAKLNGSGTILLDAADEITINADIDPTAVTLNANDDITVNAAVLASELITVSAGEDGSGSFVLGSMGSLTTTDLASDVVITAGVALGDVTLSGNVTSDSLTATAFGSITDDTDGDLAITDNASFDANSIVLGDDVGNDTNFGSLTLNGGSATVIEDDSMEFSDSSTLTGSLTASGSSINLTGTVSAGSAVLTSTAGDITDVWCGQYSGDRNDYPECHG